MWNTYTHLWQDWGRKNVKAQIANFNMSKTQNRCWVEKRSDRIQNSSKIYKTTYYLCINTQAVKIQRLGEWSAQNGEEWFPFWKKRIRGLSKWLWIHGFDFFLKMDNRCSRTACVPPETSPTLLMDPSIHILGAVSDCWIPCLPTVSFFTSFLKPPTSAFAISEGMHY